MDLLLPRNKGGRESANHVQLHFTAECLSMTADISSPNLKEMIDVYFNSMHPMTQEGIDLIQNLTVGQSSNET